MKTFIIPTSVTEFLAEKIKRKTGDFKIIFPEKNKNGKRYFPDGEIYMKISKAGDLKDKKVIVLHSGAPNPNEGLIELELILQILKENKVRPEIFFTYFPYGMQDKVFEKGETNVAQSLIKKLINYYKVKKFYIIDPHFGGELWMKKYPIINISAIPILSKIAKKNFGKNILFLSPDKGGQKRTGIIGIKKERVDSFKVKIVSPKINSQGKIIAVVDDIIETGGTLLKFYNFLKKSGVKKIIALATHGIVPEGVSKIKKKYYKLYLTNTVNQREANIDITELILKNILNKK